MSIVRFTLVLLNHIRRICNINTVLCSRQTYFSLKQTNTNKKIFFRSGMSCVSAHRVVLASASPYFHAMFNGEQVIQCTVVHSEQTDLFSKTLSKLMKHTDLYKHSFPDDLVEKNLSEITIHDVDPLALTLLVDFAYTGELVVTEENVQVKI